jgi:hypothetical protein
MGARSAALVLHDGGTPNLMPADPSSTAASGSGGNQCDPKLVAEFIADAGLLNFLHSSSLAGSDDMRGG